MFKYIQHRQKQWEKKWDEEEKRIAEEAEREEARIAEAQAQARRQKLLIEQQEANRLRQQSLQRQQEQAEEKWDKHFDSLLSDIKDQFQKNNNDKLDEIKVIIKTRQPSLQELDWETWLTDPLNQRLAFLDFEHAIELFKRDNLLAKRRRPARGSHKRLAINYGLSFTGNDATGARADLVATNFTPNDPTNKGFAEDSGRKPLAESGFTISYWWRPDENYAQSFPIGWKRDEHARFGFGFRNASKPWFEIGTSEVNNTTWSDMFDNSGNSDLQNTLLDNGEGTAPGSGNKLILGKWYHIVVTYAGTDNPDGDGDMLQKFYINGYHIYGGFGEGKQSVNWTSHTNSQMARGLAFGMRLVVASGTDSESGLRNAKYNNGNACGLDEIAIYSEAKDADWVTSVYNGATSFNHKNSGGDGLVAYWKFTEAGGTTVKDHGPYGWHGTLTNALHGTKIDTAINDLPPSGTPTWIKTPEGYDQ